MTSAARRPRPAGRWVETLWRSLAILIAPGLLVVIATRWTRFEGRAGWQLSDDAYLQSDQTPIAADAAIASSDAALVQDEIGLFKALRGGWRPPAAAKPAP